MQFDADLDAVYGIDFSAAAKDAGASTWVARCNVAEGTLVVDALASASEFLGVDSTARDDVLPALADHLGTVDGPAVAGLDFPFSLPAWVLGDDDWRSFVESTPARWGVLGDVDGPRDLYDAVSAAVENGRAARRETDEAHGGQAPAGFRIKTQTYYGISMLLRHLIGYDGVCVPPVELVPDHDIAVLETYPAAVFDGLPGAARTGYKKDHRRHVIQRRLNVNALVDAGVRFDADAAVDADVRSADGVAADCAVATDDALDAVAAAYAAARHYSEALDGDYSDADRAEARIYA